MSPSFCARRRESINFEMASFVHSTNGIHVTFEEVLPGSTDMRADVVHGTDLFGRSVPAVNSSTGGENGGEKNTGHVPAASAAANATVTPDAAMQGRGKDKAVKYRPEVVR